MYHGRNDSLLTNKIIAKNFLKPQPISAIRRLNVQLDAVCILSMKWRNM